MDILTIIRVVLFDVILHICDTITDLLQIYFCPDCSGETDGVDPKMAQHKQLDQLAID